MHRFPKWKFRKCIESDAKTVLTVSSKYGYENRKVFRRRPTAHRNRMAAVEYLAAAISECVTAEQALKEAQTAEQKTYQKLSAKAEPRLS